MKSLLMLTLAASLHATPIYSIYNYTVDVAAPNVLVDGITLTDLSGVGRSIDGITDWVVSFEDIALPHSDGDYNDLVVFVPKDGGPLVVLGHLASYANFAERSGSQVLFTSPQGQLGALTGTVQTWEGRVVQAVPETGTFGLAMVAFLVLCGLGLRIERRAR